MSNYPKVYAGLKKHRGFWRVDGVGPIRETTTLGTRVSLYLTRVNDPLEYDPYRKESLFDPGEVIEYAIPVAALTEFGIGSIWYEGQRVFYAESREFSYLQKERFCVDPAGASYATLKDSVVLHGQTLSSPLPDNQFPFGLNRELVRKSVHCIVPVRDNEYTDYLIIPCTELLRLYYGVSSRLLSAVVSGRTGFYIDWSRSENSDHCAHLWPNYKLSQLEMSVLARAVSSSYAKEKLFSIHKRIAALNSSNKSKPSGEVADLFLKCEFPFLDETNLKISGKRVRMAPATRTSKPLWGIYVVKVNDCPHDFPERASFVKDEVLRSAPPLDDEESSSISGSDQLSHDWDDVEVLDDAADARLKRLAIIKEESCLSGALNTQFIKKTNLISGPAISSRHSHGTEIRGVSFADGNYSAHDRGILGIGTYRQQSASNFEDTLEPFESMAKELALLVEGRGWVLRRPECIRQASSDQYYCFPRRIGPRRTWQLIDKKKPGGRSRAASIFEVNLGKQGLVYLLELELRPGEKGECTALLHRRDFQSLRKTDLDEYIYLSAMKRKWTIRSHKPETVESSRRAARFFKLHHADTIKHPHTAKPREISKKTEVEKLKICERFFIDPRDWAVSVLRRIEKASP